jgi:hypothetical protein
MPDLAELKPPTRVKTHADMLQLFQGRDFAEMGFQKEGFRSKMT